jgi:hypothetical protein
MALVANLIILANYIEPVDNGCRTNVPIISGKRKNPAEKNPAGFCTKEWMQQRVTP